MFEGEKLELRICTAPSECKPSHFYTAMIVSGFKSWAVLTAIGLDL